MKEMNIPTKTLRQYKLLLKVLKKEGYTYEGHKIMWGDYRSKTFLCIHYADGDDKSICYCGVNKERKKEFQNIKENTIKPFTEKNIKKLLMGNRLEN